MSNVIAFEADGTAILSLVRQHGAGLLEGNVTEIVVTEDGPVALPETEEPKA